MIGHALALVLAGEPGTFQLTVTAVGLDDEASAAIAEQMEADAAPMLADAEYTVVEADADLHLRVMVEHNPDDAADLVTSVVVDAKGSVLAEAREEVCIRCDVPELAAMGLEVLTSEHLEAARGASAPEPPPPVVEPAEEPTPDAFDTKPIGPMGGVGIGLAVLGLGASVAGAVVLYKGEVDNGPTLQDFRPAGIATLSAGLGLLVVGHVLTAVDVGRRGGLRRNVRLDGTTLRF